MDELVTARLRLRPVGLGEARSVAAGVPGEGSSWAAGYPTANDIVAIGGYLEHRAAAGDPHPFGHYQLVLRADGLTIGGAGFHGPPGEGGEVEVGYGVIPPAQGHGYASEALRALLEFAHLRGVAVVRGAAGRPNVASQRVMAAAGMALVGEDETHLHYAVIF
jgi:RimJ/RimL family protein N-acetyltransferase